VGIVAVALLAVAAPALAQNGGGGDLQRMTLSDLWALAREYQIPLMLGATALVVGILWAGDVIKPGSLGRAGGRNVSAYPSALWLFAGLIVFTTLALSRSFVEAQAWLMTPTGVEADTPLRGEAVAMLGTYLISGIVGVGMVVLFSRSAGGAGLTPGWGDLPIGLGCLALALPLVKVVGDLLVLMHQQIAGAAPPEVAHPTLDLILGAPTDPWRWGLIAAAVLGAPLVEEIIYRVFLQSAILRWTGAPVAAVLLSAGAFTAVHAIGDQGIPYYALGPIFVLGVAMGVAYERTGRLGVPIVMHVGFNALNVAWALLQAG